jgi:membrane protease subunit HflK
MAWNEPGGDKRDPWGGNGRDQGPPDLDDLFRKLTGRFGGVLNRKGGGSSGGGGGGISRFGGGGLWVLIGVVAIGWVLSGIYIVDEGKRGVVLRFGRFVDTTLPGPHWHIPYPIESVEVVDVERRRFVEIGYRSANQGRAKPPAIQREALMLTQDENIVDTSLAVQYQIRDAAKYLFNVRDPDLTLKQVAESAARAVIGQSKMDFVLTEGRSEIVARIREVTQQTLDNYEIGLQISGVNLQDAQPPDEVQDSFADAIKAREDEQRFKNEAEAYSNEVIPKARGAAARQLEEANAYLEQVIAQAEGEAQRFDQLLTEYAKAPEVTRERLYLETMERVLGANRKVLLDVTEGNKMLYLPLDSLTGSMEPRSEIGSASPSSRAGTGFAADDVDRSRLRENARLRESR